MKFLEITKKDLWLLVRDRRALMVLVLLPLIFITIIGLTTGRLLGWQSSTQILTIAAADEVNYDAIPEEAGDRTMARTTARNLVTKIFNGLQNKKGLVVREKLSAKEAKELCLMDEAVAALIIGPKFIEKVDSMRPRDLFNPEGELIKGNLENLDVTLYSKNPNASTHTVVETIVFGQVFAKIVPIVTCNNAPLARLAGSVCEDLSAEAAKPPIARDTTPEIVPPANEELYQELIPQYTVMFVFFLVNIMARSFIHERELGTLRRLRIAPLGTPSLLTGKVVPFLIVSLAQTALLFFCGRLLFGMSWGNNPWLLLPVIFCTSMAATSLGLLVATIVRSDSQVSAYANTVVITMAGISGCFMPRKWLPDAMQTISLITPHAWSLIAYDNILNKPTPQLMIVLQSCVWLIGFTLLYFALGTWRFARTN